MFARLGLFLATVWFFGTVLLLDNAGNLTGGNIMQISLAPAAVFAVLGMSLSWVLAGFWSLFR